MKIIDLKHLYTFITLRDQKIMKFLCLVLNFWPRLYILQLFFRYKVGKCKVTFATTLGSFVRS